MKKAMFFIAFFPCYDIIGTGMEGDANE